MRKITYIFFALLINIKLDAQSCTTPTSKEYLDINNVKALLTNGGGMWYDQDSTKGIYGFPALSLNQGFSAGIVFSALETHGNQDLIFAGTRYQQDDGDFWSGPIVDINNPMTFQECDLWNRHFKLNKNQIDAFALSNFPIDISAVPLAIKEWPAKGNAYMQNTGMTLQRDYAPFDDKNGNGIYDPQNGDLPIIKGDQAIFWIINDYEGQIQADFSDKKLGLEIHIMAYAFNLQNDLNNATFYDYKIINRSNTSYRDFYFSKYIDIDNFDGTNDHLGVDSVNKYVYSYGRSGACSSLPNCDPIILSSFLCASNNVRLSSYYNSFLYDSQNNYFNRNLQVGLDYNGTDIDNFYFGGNPADSAEITSCHYTPNDRWFMMNSGPHNFYIGEELEFSLMVATYFEPYVGCPNRDSLITPFYENVSQLYYNETDCGFAKTITSIKSVNELNVKVYPNPNNSNTIFLDDLPNTNIQIELINALGQVILQKESLSQSKLRIENKQRGVYFLKLYNKENNTQYLDKIIFK